MTLIIATVTQNHAVLASDRRVVELPSGRVLDDDSNKTGLWCDRLIIGYTGLAQVEGHRTDLWIADTISTCRSASDVVHVLRDRSTEVFGRMPYSNSIKRHAFVGVGWSMNAPGHPLTPLVFTISTALDASGNWTAEADEHFLST